MTWIVGVGHLLVGMAYLSLGILSAWEALTQYQQRGLSRFGLGFSLMAASCGPHHLIHGWCALNGDSVPPAMLAVTLIGLPAGLTFCLLRVEAMLGGAGDRVLTASPVTVAALTAAVLGVFGVVAGQSMSSPPTPTSIICTASGVQFLGGTTATAGQRADLITFANLFVAVTYGMVGWYLVSTQVRRYMLARSWSLSGLSLAAVFPTCAAMHLILALTHGGDTATLAFDLLGVPASVYFLWVVRRLHSNAVIDWNRRPLVGVAATPKREAPWGDRPAVMR